MEQKITGILLERSGNYTLYRDGVRVYSNYDIMKVKWVAENEHKDFYLGFDAGHFIDKIRQHEDNKGDITDKESNKLYAAFQGALQFLKGKEYVSFIHYVDRLRTQLIVR